MTQQMLLDTAGAFELTHSLPTTRYRGSKRRYASYIAEAFLASGASEIHDVFGGSGSVTALADNLHVKSHYNDYYEWTTRCSRALFLHTYDRSDLVNTLKKISLGLSRTHAGFISETYSKCYFTDRENLELDGLLEVMERTRSERIKDLLFYGIAQAALLKMPMSMFHRASLKQRLTRVDRKSRNKASWDRPFGALIREFVEEAVIYGWQRNLRHTVTKMDALSAIGDIDSDELLFLDPPYINCRGGVPTYGEAYHFLEGFAQGISRWQGNLDTSGSHPMFRCQESSFETPEGWLSGIRMLLDCATRGSVVATARQYDEPGARQMRRMLKDHFKQVECRKMHASTIFSNAQNGEYLFLAT